MEAIITAVTTALTSVQTNAITMIGDVICSNDNCRCNVSS